jgi:hypothetical protein
MKSRRRIAAPKAQSLCGLCFGTTQLQQGFAAGGMGSNRHFAGQQFSEWNVRFGSEADISQQPIDVCFTPKSGHWGSAAKCPLSAKSGHCRVDTILTLPPNPEAAIYLQAKLFSA